MSPVYVATLESDEKKISTTGFDTSAGEDIVNLGFTSGSIEDIGLNQIGLSESTAEDLNVKVGEQLELSYKDQNLSFEVVGLFTNESPFLQNSVMSSETFKTFNDSDVIDSIAGKLKEDVTAEQAVAGIAPLKEEFPNLSFDSSAELKESIAGEVDNMLAVLSILLGLTMVVALIGIVMTMILSTYERTREIGLLRAVGMTRRQLRTTIRWESAIISGLGAVTGAIVGLVFAVLIIKALPDDILSVISIPFISIAIMVAVASLAGLIAATIPAIKSSYLNVLDSISHG